MPATDQNKNKFAAGIHDELLFLDLINALKNEGFVVSATAAADFIALFITFPDLEQLNFYLCPLIAKNEEEQQLFYDVYDAWLKGQRVYDIIPPPPKTPRANELHKKYIILISSIVIFFLLLIVFFTMVPRGDRIRGNTPSSTVVDSLGFENPGSIINHLPHQSPLSKKIDRSAHKLSLLNGCPVKETIEPIPDPDFDSRINPIKRVNLQLVAVLVVPLTLAVFLTAFLLTINKRRRLLQQKEVVFNSDSYEKPYDIPFSYKESLIYEEPSLIRVCSRLKDKVENEIHQLDIYGTILNTVNNYGLFSPVYQSKKQDREYFILTEWTALAEQQVQLFNYLVKVFVRENIKLTHCYFNEDMEIFYASNASAPAPWNQITQLFSHCILIVISDGDPFLSSSLPLTEKNKEIELQKWEARVLVTPVPAIDWGAKEEILSKTFNMIPADLQGWLLLLRAIDGVVKPAALLREYHTYSCKQFDFGEIEQLITYLGDEDIFQWVCALAIYHKVRWELIVEMGRRILGDKNVLFKLNYTNLLKISRIGWIKDGVLPTVIRLRLLSSLSIENELSARKVMLKMLSYSDTLLNAKSMAYKEKVVETYVNRFILYANDPGEFAAFEDDKDAFLSLWQKGHIADTALKTYLKNEQQAWTTPIASAGNNAAAVKIDDYVNEKNKAIGAYFNLERCLQITLCFLINFLLLHVIIHNLAPDLLLNGMNKRFVFIENANQREEIKISVAADSLLEALLKQNGSNHLRVVYYGADTTETEAGDGGIQPFTKRNGNPIPGLSSYNFIFPNIDFYKGYYKSGKIEVDILNKKFVTNVPLNCDQYLITFKQPDCHIKIKPSN